eukprot:TRINITY_DN3102_c0_g1_i11.p1 TRINITY_DN3102_c0_g1~~TRINITY_DN3102_c0_g1_i11.p1  ORF type:complete len:248 (-),score=62.86 TRINITY_DN3102_c0_g1_i11:107-850(-)
MFSGKVVIVTGATAGIGKATALAFAKQGATVVATGRREPEGKVLEAEAKGLPGSVEFLVVDVTKEEDIKRMVHHCVEKHGGLDVAFNNAGVGGKVPFLKESHRTYQLTMDTNVKGTWLCMKYEIEAMLQTGRGGSIINCSSIAGSNGTSKFALYTASKHAVEGMTKCVALEFASKGIRVNSVCPGPTRTDMLGEVLSKRVAKQVPVQRIGESEEIAGAVLYLASSAAGYITGSKITLDGGMTAGSKL